MTTSLKRKKSIRYNLKKNNKSNRLRLSIFRSKRHVYAQIIDDLKGVTIVSCSSLDKKLVPKDSDLTKNELSIIVGSAIAKKAVDARINEVYFDRGPYIYHGRVKSFADSARSSGLTF